MKRGPDESRGLSVQLLGAMRVLRVHVEACRRERRRPRTGLRRVQPRGAIRFSTHPRRRRQREVPRPRVCREEACRGGVDPYPVLIAVQAHEWACGRGRGDVERHLLTCVCHAIRRVHQYKADAGAATAAVSTSRHRGGRDGERKRERGNSDQESDRTLTQYFVPPGVSPRLRE
jgi:hypothetical protein